MADIQSVEIALGQSVAQNMETSVQTENSTETQQTGAHSIPVTTKAPETKPNSSVKVGPVPSSDYIMASAKGYIQGVELYDMSGNLVARNGGNYMNVGSMRDGHYILKVYTTNEVSSHHVAVKH